MSINVFYSVGLHLLRNKLYIMSINVYKHPGNEIIFSDRSVPYGELKVVGFRPKVIFCVHGTRKCRM